MRKYFGRNDIILICTLLSVSVIFLIVLNVLNRQGDRAYVYTDGVKVYELPLSIDTSVEIEGFNGSHNTLTVSGGYAYMSDATCPDKLCIHQGRINKTGQSIVCLPDRVVVKIEGKDGSEYDAVTR